MRNSRYTDRFILENPYEGLNKLTDLILYDDLGLLQSEKQVHHIQRIHEYSARFTLSSTDYLKLNENPKYTHHLGGGNHDILSSSYSRTDKVYGSPSKSTSFTDIGIEHLDLGLLT